MVIIVPFEYLALVLAIIWGMTLFNEQPDWVAWIGIAMIFASGLLVFWREAALKRHLASERQTLR